MSSTRPLAAFATLLIGTTAAMTAAAAPAAAQDEPAAPRFVNRYRLGLGLFRATDGETRRTAFRSTEGGYGITYDLGVVRRGGFSAARPLVWGVYADGAGRSDEREDGATDLRDETAWSGVGVSARVYLNAPRSPRGARLYAGAGLGAYTVSHTASARTDEGRTEFVRSYTTDVTRFGGKALAGAEWGERFFAEASYSLVGRAEAGGARTFTDRPFVASRFDGASLLLGYRF